MKRPSTPLALRAMLSALRVLTRPARGIHVELRRLNDNVERYMNAADIPQAAAREVQDVAALGRAFSGEPTDDVQLAVAEELEQREQVSQKLRDILTGDKLLPGAGAQND